MAPKPRDVHAVPGMGKVYDFRGTGLLNPVLSGGRPIVIRPLALVEHIPVVPNMHGIGDFFALGRVLNAQGLSLQHATDAEGNACLYTSSNLLCYQARGLNQQSCGTEHMHMSIAERWTERQYRAAAWVGWWVRKNHGLPARMASMRPAGTGLAIVTRTGHTTHQHEADVAGYHDRVDPGAKFSFPHLFQLIRFYDTHRSFRHAPVL